MKKIRTTVVQSKSKYGIYVWAMPDGKWVGDDEGRYMLIPSERGDQEKIKQITDAARSYGITEGEAVFVPGRRRVSDEEYSQQEARLKMGLTPDPFDIDESIEQYKRLTNGS